MIFFKRLKITIEIIESLTPLNFDPSFSFRHFRSSKFEKLKKRNIFPIFNNRFYLRINEVS